MRQHKPTAVRLLTLAILLSASFPAFSQHREYYAYGKVKDTKNQPLADVLISLRDVKTSRSYSSTTNKAGEFKFIGLPHGVYAATIKKEGYAVKLDEWNFSITQDRMQKVELPTIILVSEFQIQEAENLKQLQAEFTATAEKIRRGELDEAMDMLNKMLQANPQNPNILFLKGVCLNKKEMPVQAVEILTQVTTLSPGFAPAYEQLGQAYQMQDDREKALGYYQKAIELDPANADLLYNAGLILFQLSRISEALPMFDKALALKPSDPELLEMVGRCYVNQADYARAIDYLEKAKVASTDPDRVKFLDELIVKLKDMVKK